MKRNIKILLTMLLLAFTLVGCGERKYETKLVLFSSEGKYIKIEKNLTFDEIEELKWFIKFEKMKDFDKAYEFKKAAKIFEKLFLKHNAVIINLHVLDTENFIKYNREEILNSYILTKYGFE